jgi:hypothetical protein
MFTTAGSTILAIFENSEESCVGEGIAIAVAPGLSPGRSAFTDLLMTVPMTTPTANVAMIKQKKSSLRFLIVSIILSKTIFIFSIPSFTEFFSLPLCTDHSKKVRAAKKVFPNTILALATFVNERRKQIEGHDAVLAHVS